MKTKALLLTAAIAAVFFAAAAVVAAIYKIPALLAGTLVLAIIVLAFVVARLLP